MSYNGQAEKSDCPVFVEVRNLEVRGKNYSPEKFLYIINLGLSAGAQCAPHNLTSYF